MKKSVWIPVFMILVIAAGAAGFIGTRAGNGAENGLAGRATAMVQKGSIEDVVTAQGTLEPKNYVDVGVQVSGQLEKVNVKIGDVVNQGDLIAEIDPRTYEARVKADEAHIRDLNAQIVQQQAAVEKSARDLERNRKMAKSDAVSKETLENSETAARVAQAQLESLNAQLDVAQSTLEGDQANLGYTKIYAPMSGTVLTQDPREGQTLNASQTAPVVARIGDLDVLTVRAQVAEADIMSLKHDMPVYFTTLRSPDIKWEGKARLIQPSPNIVNQVVLYDVLVDVDNRDRRLMTGMSAQTFFVVARADDVPVIPVTALGKRMAKQDSAAGQAYNVRVVRGKDISDKIVHIGLMDRKLAEVKDGLVPDDTVLLGVPATSGQESNAGPRFNRGPRL